MAQIETVGEIHRFIEIGWRRKWVILTSSVTIVLIASFWALYQPNLYRSTSSIFIESQKVPQDYVRPTVTTDIEGRMRYISQQLTSRTKLLTVIENLDLYPEAMEKGVPDEVIVAQMRKNLSVESPNLRDATFFMVHFIHEDPTKAMMAVSDLVSLFVRESLQLRENQAQGTTLFIEEELENTRAKLEAQEKQVQAYKGKYMGELPNQLEANLRILDNLQLHITTNQESQRELDGRLMLIEQEISRLEGGLTVTSNVGDGEGGSLVTSSTLNQLVTQRDALRARITNMDSMYTGRHPDLLAARRELEQIDGKIRAIQDELGKANTSDAPVLVNQDRAFSVELINLRRQLTETKPRLASLRREEKNLRRQISEYQKRVEASPVREQQLAKLTRDYENTKASYESLLTNMRQAQMSENMEKRQQGEKFQILDPANFPEKPFLPNRPKLIGIGLMGGLGFGIGLAILLEALFPAFYSLNQLQQHVREMPITFGIPHISSPAEIHNLKTRMTIGAVTAVVAIVIVLILVSLLGMDVASYFKIIGSNAKEML